ncbi:MAG: YgfZ/GcvT domain-containing protein [Gemmataceae bacterium]
MPDSTPLHEAAAQAGAHIIEESGWLIPRDFGDPVAEFDQAMHHAVLFDVSHRTKVEVSGADAGTFLNNLCTNDVKSLSAGSGCEVFFTNIKAKVVAHGFLYRLDKMGVYWLDAVPGQAEKIIQHLDHFLISEHVEFADRTREFAQLHVAGPEARSILKKAWGDDLPELRGHQLVLRNVGEGAACQIRRQDLLGVPGYDLVCPNGQASEVWEKLLHSGVRPAGSAVYEALRIRAGTPQYGLDIDDNTLAPEVNRIPQTICYTKGCYLGQEPIVRARDLGHVNRTLQRLTVATAEPIVRGAKLVRDGKEVGQITSSATAPGTKETFALAYVRRGNTDTGTAMEVVMGEARFKATVGGGVAK